MKRILLAIFIIPVIASAQKQTSLVIYLPENIQKEKFQITFNNGKEQKYFNVKSDSNSITIREPFYSDQVVLILHYPGRTPYYPHWAIYYINDKPAEIRLRETDTSKNIFNKVALKNVVDAKPLGVDQMRVFTEKEHAAVIEAHKAVMASPHIDSLKDIAMMKARIEMEKQMAYVKDHGSQYYSFFMFGQGLMLAHYFHVDTMIAVFNQVFPAKFRNSWEGKEMMQLLKIRRLREQKREVPDFTAKDIDNNTISLHQYRNRYVLINFWATWCVPCVQEFPALNKITANFPEDKLVRIFITQDKEMAVLERSMKKYDLKGIHLFADSEVIKKYKAFAIPQVYLIDKDGKIIYDRDELRDYELEQLSKVVQKVLGQP